MDTTLSHPANEYGRYCVPAGLETRPAAKAVLAGGVYEPDTIRFMRNHAGAGDIIHAGAFFGDFIPALSGALASDARLWAFEPNPGNHAAAEKTIALNDLENVTLTNAALSNREEEVLFRTSDAEGRSLGGLSHFVTEEGDGVEPVQAVMLDYVVPRTRNVSILQLDVEGHEKQALRGAYHLIYRCRPILILEYFGQLQWINRTFRGLNYEKVGKLHGNFVYACAGHGLTL
ncbi:FkbM family methyltransferase [Aestuariicoccus sp. MJ-SS9]|uniref:FkbM family methyltransferase n=1 Tax=Aestuariicoccus sp. MJ-SS9 TaxID=3079855 RepID=UPI002906CAA2|nr:FkbM family methyltransferase [Aestuariicoccus sp. MJ-SS9]MDU8910010.1 FkbM family methyltransferase [Aestuariicoccus sp. MJ-SS9]